MLWAFMVVGAMPSTQAVAAPVESLSIGSLVASVNEPTGDQAQGSVTEKSTHFNPASHAMIGEHDVPMSKGCGKSCEETCSSTICMTVILNHDIFNLGSSDFAGRLRFYSIDSSYVAQSHSLFHPPKS